MATELRCTPENAQAAATYPHDMTTEHDLPSGGTEALAVVPVVESGVISGSLVISGPLPMIASVVALPDSPVATSASVVVASGVEMMVVTSAVVSMVASGVVGMVASGVVGMVASGVVMMMPAN